MIHYSDALNPLTSKVKRSKYATVDIESKRGESQKRGFTRPFLVGYFDGSTYLQTRGPECVQSMALFLLSPANEGMTYYAHNGGGFDWLHFLPVIKALGYHFEILTVSSSIQMLIVKKSADDHGKGWRFLDSFKLIPTSLGAACTTYGTSQKLEEHDLDLDENNPAWDLYLKRDCVALYEVLERFHTLVETRLQGEVGITAASTAMKTFRRGYQAYPIQRNTKYHDFFRECYYGGRVEIFKEQGKGLHYYDINSAYPHAMLSPMPVGDVLDFEDEKPSGLLRKGRVGFAFARVNVPLGINIPCLPVKDEKTGRLTFPVGKLQGYWSAVELERAESMGCSVHWDRSIWIEARPVLAPYVRALYAYRDKSSPDYDEGLALTAKLLLNSLYGKFGMCHEREKIVILGEGQVAEEGWRAAAPLEPDCQIWHVKEEVDAPYIIPQISAHITALSRLRLHDFLLAADENGGLCYCDTDSIITTEDLSSICGPELGAIKDEGDGATYEGEFLLPKLYCLTDEKTGKTKLAMKGYEKDGRDGKKRFHTKNLFDRVKGGETITFERLEKIGTMARAQFAKGPEMRVISRQLRSRDEKRIHDVDSGSTSPIYLEQW